MDILKYILIGVLVLIMGYVAFRIAAMAIFKSWFDVKKSEERRNAYETTRTDRRDGEESGGDIR
jgi:hypothetical protein